MPVETLSPADQTIAESKAAMEQFFESVNKEVFEPQAKQRVEATMGVKPEPAKVQSNEPTKPTTPAPVTPTAPKPADPKPVEQPINPSALPDFSDIPGSDALDKPGVKLRANNWKRLHEKADHFAAQVAVVTKELESLKSAAPKATDPQTAEQLTKLAQEKDQLVAQLEAVAFQNSPRFKQMFEAREKAAITMAKQAVGPQLADQVAKLMELPEGSFRDSQIADMLENIKDNPIRANKLASAVSLIDQLSAEKQVAIEGSKQYISQWQQEQTLREQQAMEQRKQKVNEVFSNELNEWKKQAPNLIDDAAANVAKEVFAGSSSLEGAARAALWGAIGPKVAAQAKALEAELAAAKEELARLRNVQPGASSDAGGTIESDTEAPLPNPHMGQYSEGILAAALKAGLPLR